MNINSFEKAVGVIYAKHLELASQSGEIGEIIASFITELGKLEDQYKREERAEKMEEKGWNIP